MHFWDILLQAGNFNVLCAVIAGMFLLDLLAYLPFFYVAFSKTEDKEYKPERSSYLLAIGLGWFIATVNLAFGSPNARLVATIFLLGLFRHYYINRRWSSIRRGFGAPGYMSHWTVFYLLLLQVCAALDSTGWLAGRALTMMRIDFAVIMLCAGTYKYLIGYAHSEGWEYGRVNPMWGYFFTSCKNSSPHGPYIIFTNAMAFGMEVLAGFMMLTPGFEMVGSLIISGSFFFTGLNIRLGRLSYLMTALPCVYYPTVLPSLMASAPTFVDCPHWVLQLISGAITCFIVLLPLVKVSQYSNLFANRSLPEPLQGWITRYANFVPITIWRVFTPDVTNFFIRMYQRDPETGRETVILNDATYALANWSEPRMKLRFYNVTESIAITSVFTTLKYFPSNRPLFDGKLLTYARSLQHDLDRPVKLIRFEYVTIVKQKDGFLFDPVGNFYVDLEAGSVREEKLAPTFDFSAPAKYSPVRESIAPGSYVVRSV